MPARALFLTRRVFIALLLGTCVLVSAPGYAQTGGRLDGDVADETGAPLTSVVVALRGAAERVVQTGPDGRFAFQDVPDGEYELNATLRGFAPATRDVRFTGGKATPVSIVLRVQILDEITVTAARTGQQEVLSTPIAVSVLSASELQGVHMHTVADIAGRAPSVTFSQNSDYSQLTIRGIGTNVVFAGSDPSSAVYVDGVYLARPVMVVADFLDLERAEILRGPQGTLYGRNAVGGALHLITMAPSNRFDASARLLAGDFGTLRAEARVNGPILGDRVVGNAAVLRGVSRGYVRDLAHPDHALGGEDVTAARGKLRIALGDRSDLVVSADLTHQDPVPLTYAKVLAVKPGFEVDNPPNLHEVRASTLAESRTVQYGAAVRLNVQVTPITTLSSLTAFRKLDYNVINDADITELDLTAVDLHEHQHQLSEEVAISQKREKLTWLAGLFLFRERDRQPTFIRVTEPRLGSLLEPDVEARSAAGFGQMTRAVTRRVSVTAGLRYSHERKSIDNAGRLSPLDQPQVLVPGSAYAYTDAISHTAWTPKLGIEFHASRTLLAYGSATRGFKSGGFNFSSREAGLGYAPESAWSYEGGVKASLGRARLTVAAFQTDYRDLQVQTAIRPGVIDISNAAEATIHGVEVEGVTQVTDTWEAGGHFSWLDAIYDRYVAVGLGGITGDAAGHRLNNAPEWSGRVWLEWRRRLGRAGHLAMRADSRWQMTVYFTPFNDDIQRQRPYGLLDVNAQFDSSRWWTVGIYARNVTNEDFITGTFSTPVTAIGGRPGYQRQVGVQLTVEL